MMFLLSLYLMLSLSNQRQGQELHIIFMIMMLISTVFFCHSLIRLCLLVFEYRNLEYSSNVNPNMVESTGYRNPVTPIPVFMANDEGFNDISGINRVPPPAYGLWRESVVSQVNILFLYLNTLLTYFGSVWILIRSFGSIMKPVCLRALL